MTNRQTHRPHYIGNNRPHLCTPCMRCGLITALHGRSYWQPYRVLNRIVARMWTELWGFWDRRSAQAIHTVAHPAFINLHMRPGRGVDRDKSALRSNTTLAIGPSTRNNKSSTLHLSMKSTVCRCQHDSDYIRLFNHEGSTKSITDKKIKVTGQGQEVCTRT